MSSVVQTIEKLIAEKGVSKTKFYNECGISTGAFSYWNTGKTVPSKTSINRIAHYFGVTAESIIDGTAHYTGQKEKPSGKPEGQTVYDNHGVIGEAHAPVTILNGERVHDDQEAELVSMFRRMTVLNKARLMVYASELLK